MFRMFLVALPDVYRRNAGSKHGAQAGRSCDLLQALTLSAAWKVKHAAGSLATIQQRLPLHEICKLSSPFHYQFKATASI